MKLRMESCERACWALKLCAVSLERACWALQLRAESLERAQDGATELLTLQLTLSTHQRRGYEMTRDE